MTNKRYFDDEDENIFSDKEISHNTPSKGNRIIPTWLMGDFNAWLDRYHPEILMVSNLSQRDLKPLIDEFEYSVGQHYDYTIQEWQYNLRRG
jgi:hypothetical protein